LHVSFEVNLSSALAVCRYWLSTPQFNNTRTFFCRHSADPEILIKSEAAQHAFGACVSIIANCRAGLWHRTENRIHICILSESLHPALTAPWRFGDFTASCASLMRLPWSDTCLVQPNGGIITSRKVGNGNFIMASG